MRLFSLNFLLFQHTKFSLLCHNIDTRQDRQEAFVFEAEVKGFAFYFYINPNINRFGFLLVLKFTKSRFQKRKTPNNL